MTRLNRGLDALALLLVWLFVPGTGKQIATMEEMNWVFGARTARHADYQINKVAPWYFNHYIRRKEVGKLEPLYRHVEKRNRDNHEENGNTTGIETKRTKLNGEVHELERVHEERDEG